MHNCVLLFYFEVPHIYPKEPTPANGAVFCLNNAVNRHAILSKNRHQANHYGGAKHIRSRECHRSFLVRSQQKLFRLRHRSMWRSMEGLYGKKDNCSDTLASDPWPGTAILRPCRTRHRRLHRSWCDRCSLWWHSGDTCLFGQRVGCVQGGARSRN